VIDSGDQLDSAAIFPISARFRAIYPAQASALYPGSAVRLNYLVMLAAIYARVIWMLSFSWP